MLKKESTSMEKIFTPNVIEKDMHSPNPEAFPGVPRWVKVLAIIALVLLLLFAFFRFTGIVGDLSSAQDSHMSASLSLLTGVQEG
jgi:hypothetical protein